MRIRAIFATLVLVVFGSGSLGQHRGGSGPGEKYSPELMATLARLRQSALKDTYAYSRVAHLTDNIGPRLSGSAQAAQAVEYVAEELRKLGLEVQLEKTMVPHWVRGLETGELVEYIGQAPATSQKVVLTALGGSVATPHEGLIADVIVAHDFDQLNVLGRARVAGKIVLFDFPFDNKMAAEGFALQAYGQAVAYRAGGPSAAAKLGAVAALVRSVGNADYRLPHTGALDYAADAPKIPAAAVTAEDADMIAHLTSQGKVRMHLTMTPETLPDAPSYNVIGDLKGTQHPEQIVIVSGHLDSWGLGTGAIDDGAGVAVAMETAQLIRQLGLHPKRTIRVIAWMNEENGGAGSLTYAKDHASEVDNHVGAIESDLGAGHPLGFFLYAGKGAMPLLEPVSQILAKLGAGLMNPSDDPVEADITPIQLGGVPGFGVLQDTRTYFNYHHTAADTLDKIVFAELAENAAAMAVLAYALADMPELLPRPPRRASSEEH
jgi:carboxypeptidase Q